MSGLFIYVLFNPLAPALIAQWTLQKTWHVNFHAEWCMFLADNFRWHLVFSASQCKLTKTVFWHQSVDDTASSSTHNKRLERV